MTGGRLLSTGLVASVLSLALVGLPMAGHAEVADTSGQIDAERAIQAYLSLWAHDADINLTSIERFYAPTAIYYGHTYSRAEILADKRAYIRRWPQRSYRELPGTLSAHCNDDRSLCKVSVKMTWRRGGATGLSTGTARLSFDFVPSDGARKIARESARVLRQPG